MKLIETHWNGSSIARGVGGGSLHVGGMPVAQSSTPPASKLSGFRFCYFACTSSMIRLDHQNRRKPLELMDCPMRGGQCRIAPTPVFRDKLFYKTSHEEAKTRSLLVSLLESLSPSIASSQYCPLQKKELNLSSTPLRSVSPKEKTTANMGR